MGTVTFEIVKKIAVVSVNVSGWTLELNLVRWNDTEPKFDLRYWSEDHSRCGKGLTFWETELFALEDALRLAFEYAEDTHIDD